MRVKVCGMTEISQLRELEQMKVEFAGFIFYPKSPRYLLRWLEPAELKKEKFQINKVGVFVNATQQEVMKMVDACGLYIVQLHGDETPKFCENLSNYVTVVKVIRVGDGSDIMWKIHPYMDACDMFLFDTEGSNFGGTGKKFDWNKLKDLNIGKPFFLSGGIGPDDVEALHDFAKAPVAKDLFSIDVNSRFEINPGVKDIEKVKRFLTQLNPV